MKWKKDFWIRLDIYYYPFIYEAYYPYPNFFSIKLIFFAPSTREVESVCSNIFLFFVTSFIWSYLYVPFQVYLYSSRSRYLSSSFLFIFIFRCQHSKSSVSSLFNRLLLDSVYFTQFRFDLTRKFFVTSFRNLKIERSWLLRKTTVRYEHPRNSCNIRNIMVYFYKEFPISSSIVRKIFDTFIITFSCKWSNSSLLRICFPKSVVQKFQQSVKLSTTFPETRSIHFLTSEKSSCSSNQFFWVIKNLEQLSRKSEVSLSIRKNPVLQIQLFWVIKNFENEKPNPSCVYLIINRALRHFNTRSQSTIKEFPKKIWIFHILSGILFHENNAWKSKFFFCMSAV